MSPAHKKHNALALKKEYLTGEYADLREFAERRGISYAYVQQMAAKGKWKKTLVRVSEKAEERLVEIEARRLVEKRRAARARHERIGLTLQETGLKVYNRKKEGLSAKDAANVVHKGVQIERGALGMEDTSEPVQAGDTFNVEQLAVILEDPGKRSRVREVLKRLKPTRPTTA